MICVSCEGFRFSLCLPSELHICVVCVWLKCFALHCKKAAVGWIRFEWWPLWTVIIYSIMEVFDIYFTVQVVFMASLRIECGLVILFAYSYRKYSSRQCKRMYEQNISRSRSVIKCGCRFQTMWLSHGNASVLPLIGDAHSNAYANWQQLEILLQIDISITSVGCKINCNCNWLCILFRKLVSRALAKFLIEKGENWWATWFFVKEPHVACEP